MRAYTFVPRTYTTMNDAQYKRTRTEYKNTAFQKQEKWENYFYNAVGRCIEHSDPSHLSDVIFASRELNQYRNVSRVIKALHMPWAFSYMEKPHGDVPKANKQRLAYLRMHWQVEFSQAMDRLEIEVQKSVDIPVVEWWNKSAKATIHRLFNEAKKRGVNKSEFQEHVMELIQAAA